MTSEKSVSIEAVRNGWVLTWLDPLANGLQGQYQAIAGLGQIKPTCGKEIFADKKKLLKRLEAFL